VVVDDLEVQRATGRSVHPEEEGETTGAASVASLARVLVPAAAVAGEVALVVGVAGEDPEEALVRAGSVRSVVTARAVTTRRRAAS
jgi:hypothetical protein